MNTARLLKYVWPFYSIMDERVKVGWRFEFVKTFCKVLPGDRTFVDEAFLKLSDHSKAVTGGVL